MSSLSDINGADIKGPGTGASNTEASGATASGAEAMIQRLVVGRLASPGVLDRRQLHDTYDRLSQPPTRHSPRGLPRGVEASAPGAPGLPLAQIAHPSEHGVTPASEAGSVARTPGIFGAGVSSSSSSPTEPIAPTVSTVPTALPAPTVATATARMSTSTIARTPLLLAESDRAVSRADAAPRAPSASIPNDPPPAAITTSVTRADSGHNSVMRKADRAMPVARTGNSLTHSADARAAALPASSLSSHLAGASHPALPIFKQRPGATPSDHGSAEPLVRVAEIRPSEAVSSNPFGGLRISSQPLHGPLQTVTPGVMRTPASLIFRKPELATAASPPNTVKQPAITAATPNVIAREAAAPKWEHKSSAHTKAHAGVSHSNHEPRLEQIIEKVERHLARQLEIESERQGVRQWR